MKAWVNSLIFCGLFVLLSLATLKSWGQQTPMELSCRTKAKEVAAQTYNSCVTDARAVQIEKIRKEYQKQLTELKTKYDRELKKLKGSGAGGVGSASAGSKPKPTKGVAKALPTRKEPLSPAAPLGAAASEEKSVVLQETPGIPAATESPMPQNDASSDFNMELKPTPPENDGDSTTSGEVY